MDKDKFAKRGFIVAGVSGVEVETEFLNPDDSLSEIKPDAAVGNTGRLELFRIIPVRVGLPEFLVRIGHDNHEAVDVDLIGDSDGRSAFALQSFGYIGHKTQDLKTDPRSYRVNIEVPSVGRIFSGILTMKGLGLGVRIFENFHMNDKVDALVIQRSDQRTEK